MTAPATPLVNATLVNASAVGQVAPVADGNSGASFTVDWTKGATHKITLSATCVFAFTAPIGPVTNENLTIYLTQNGGFTATWPATVKWTGAAPPTLTSTAAAVDVITFKWDGTNYWGILSPNFA